ncbi:MAG: endonuclease/exonuclease/phosphatase family protein [Chitinophagales bacterium]
MIKTRFLLFVLTILIGFSCYSTPANNSEAVQADSISEAADLKILSWNIYMLPPVVAKKGKRPRAHAIVEELKKGEFDVIVFQEAFLTAARQIIGEGLKEVYPYAYGPINRKPGLKISGGVWVLSKMPMKPLSTIEFTDCATWDCMSRKGAVLLEGEWKGKTFQVLGTHLQADGYDIIRQKQMDDIYMNLLMPYKKDSVPQIVCGDMNTEQEMKEYYCSMLECLDAENGNLDGIETCSYNGVDNEIAESVWGKKKTNLDYILLRRNNTKIKAVKRYISVLKKGKKHLSDHYGVVCEVKF